MDQEQLFREVIIAICTEYSKRKRDHLSFAEELDPLRTRIKQEEDNIDRYEYFIEKSKDVINSLTARIEKSEGKNHQQEFQEFEDYLAHLGILAKIKDLTRHMDMYGVESTFYQKAKESFEDKTKKQP
jgi:hypothetical protein